jgi:hypothetical protein
MNKSFPSLPPKLTQEDLNEAVSWMSDIAEEVAFPSAKTISIFAPTFFFHHYYSPKFTRLNPKCRAALKEVKRSDLEVMASLGLNVAKAFVGVAKMVIQDADLDSSESGAENETATHSKGNISSVTIEALPDDYSDAPTQKLGPSNSKGNAAPLAPPKTNSSTSTTKTPVVTSTSSSLHVSLLNGGFHRISQKCYQETIALWNKGMAQRKAKDVEKEQKEKEKSSEVEGVKKQAIAGVVFLSSAVALGLFFVIVGVPLLVFGCVLEFAIPSLYFALASFCVRVAEIMQIALFLFQFNSRLFFRIAWKFVGGWIVGWKTYLLELVFSRHQIISSEEIKKEALNLSERASASVSS